MGAVLDPEFWARWLSIVVIDLTLAGDNALVIALAVRTLPRKQQLLGRLWGTVGAVVLRLAFITVATFLLRIPFLQLVGGLLLVWIAVKLVRQPAGGQREHARAGSSLREAVWVIVVADAVMSLDNVLAVAAAAHGDLLLVVFGIALSLPLVVWGSGLLARLMTRFGWIVWIGGGILGYVAAEMMLADPVLKSVLGEALETLDVVPLLLGLTMAGLGWWFTGRAPASPAQSDPGGRHRKGGEAPLRDL